MDTNRLDFPIELIATKEELVMDKDKVSDKKDAKGQKTQPTRTPRKGIEAPGFKWVTKGEKGSGVEPGIRLNKGSE
jgi:hypothetical protein